MNCTIFKFILFPSKSQTIELPIDAEILTVQNQNEEVCMWVKLDPSAPKINRTFAVFGTGWDINADSKLNYIGSVQLESGKLVFHVFEYEV